MKLEEVLPALREGKKIRRKDIVWENNYGFIFIKNGKIIFIKGNEIIFNSFTNNKYVLDKEDLNANDWEIIDEKKIVKLRDLTEEQYDKWIKNNCTKYGDYCNSCPFQKVRCDNDENKNDVWIENKELYSDKFLDQEIEIED